MVSDLVSVPAVLWRTHHQSVQSLQINTKLLTPLGFLQVLQLRERCHVRVRELPSGTLSIWGHLKGHFETFLVPVFQSLIQVLN